MFFCIAGMYFFPIFFRGLVHIPTSVQTLDIKKTTVVDRNGNPIVVAGVVTFQVVDSIRAAFGTSNLSSHQVIYNAFSFLMPFNS